MGRNWAIVVGINDYDNLRALKYAERDAASVRDFFGELGFEQVYFFAAGAPAIQAKSGAPISAEPTTSRLRNFLRRRLQGKPLEAGDTLWFFFAGHGKRKNERDYLMPIDADPGDVTNTGLAVRDLTEQLRGSGAGNVILLVDACRDDGSRDGVGIGLEKQQGVITLFSCAPEQQSYEIDELRAGAFTYALLQGLRIQGEGNCATVARLAEHVRVQVPYLVERYRRTRQNPYLVAEPASKQNLILLPRQASPADVLMLKNAALQAENRGDRDLARDFWLRVLAVGYDMEAVQAIERLAAGSSTTRRSRAGMQSGSRSSTSVSIPQLPQLPRRQMLQLLGLGGGAMGFAVIGKVVSDAVKSSSSGIKPAPTLSPSQTPQTFSSDNLPETPEPPKSQTWGGRKLEDFQFETVQLSDTGKITKRETLTRKRFNQKIAGDVSLQMVQIQAGKFLMGSPVSEAGRRDIEGPQHEVTVPNFFMAQTPVTQAQWKAVAKLPKVKTDLKPEPSKFKGDRRPVEQVSWWEAQEFCDRLSKLTGLTYRLPSEAEWEYACRAGTKTPFHFGHTITPDLANYDGNYTYDQGAKGKYRELTTDVVIFPANAWGLNDIHGNVWEWCADHWHENYQGAPTNGTAWLKNKKDANRLLRGGSWDDYPADCRSATRLNYSPGFRNNLIGFRVCLSVAAQ
ncbi:SUMF1/EgtB/PvdO family nonheme iron enzyme [filamentous cyanobacterium LEGE 11480]|uniref:SUMF1/EgtB/PvdO family nonheme iron enzyme n=1 Tax=Romeriopsis navalis LEGE 11480 TaxID=2777977 RepID=A0A928Z4U8_9CYAN|nr:SUMF1/EgtB/PvdO family nonheme iron enzyme [Romeriopsis navalis]MBE9033001.1 SUMF1/EgtB/PvdO family nonheme iron enzyme [Romeriopsis navalis LEGE 11480]